MRHLEKDDRQGRQKLLILTIDLAVNVGGEGGSSWVAGQVRHLEKEYRHGGQKLLILIIDQSIDVGGVDNLCWMTG